MWVQMHPSPEPSLELPTNPKQLTQGPRLSPLLESPLFPQDTGCRAGAFASCLLTHCSSYVLAPGSWDLLMNPPGPCTPQPCSTQGQASSLPVSTSSPCRLFSKLCHLAFHRTTPRPDATITKGSSVCTAAQPSGCLPDPRDLITPFLILLLLS